MEIVANGAAFRFDAISDAGATCPNVTPDKVARESESFVRPCLKGLWTS